MKNKQPFNVSVEEHIALYASPRGNLIGKCTYCGLSNVLGRKYMSSYKVRNKILVFDLLHERCNNANI